MPESVSSDSWLEFSSSKRGLRGRTNTERWCHQVELPESGDGCWMWRGARRHYGYGVFAETAEGGWSRQVQSHRFAYEMFVGPIPDGLVIDHLCNTPGCVNPEHLRAVTQQQNVLRGASSGARVLREGKCCKGHELTPDNLVHSAIGKTVCKRCAKQRNDRHMRLKTLGNVNPRPERWKSHCKHGHELSGTNIYEWRGQRYCRECRMGRLRKYREVAT